MLIYTVFRGIGQFQLLWRPYIDCQSLKPVDLEEIKAAVSLCPRRAIKLEQKPAVIPSARPPLTHVQ